MILGQAVVVKSVSDTWGAKSEQTMTPSGYTLTKTDNVNADIYTHSQTVTYYVFDEKARLVDATSETTTESNRKVISGLTSGEPTAEVPVQDTDNWIERVSVGVEFDFGTAGLHLKMGANEEGGWHNLYHFGPLGDGPRDQSVGWHSLPVGVAKKVGDMLEIVLSPIGDSIAGNVLGTHFKINAQGEVFGISDGGVETLLNVTMSELELAPKVDAPVAPPEYSYPWDGEVDYINLFNETHWGPGVNLWNPRLTIERDDGYEGWIKTGDRYTDLAKITMNNYGDDIYGAPMWFGDGDSETGFTFKLISADEDQVIFYANLGSRQPRFGWIDTYVDQWGSEVLGHFGYDYRGHDWDYDGNGILDNGDVDGNGDGDVLDGYAYFHLAEMVLFIKKGKNGDVLLGKLLMWIILTVGIQLK
ncbi:MAG: hypothetical protein IPN90_04295 [Elusimicrobia bacterium]|nr:hypothetical protein [Elusimicrobiota bacterium]